MCVSIYINKDNLESILCSKVTTNYKKYSGNTIRLNHAVKQLVFFVQDSFYSEKVRPEVMPALHRQQARCEGTE